MFSEAKNDKKAKYFLLTSGSLGQELMEIVQLHSRIVYAFVFCMSVSYHQTWANNYEKIKLVTNNLDDLIQHFRSYYEIRKFDDLEIKTAYHFIDNDRIRNYFLLSFVIDLCTKKGDLNRDQAIDDFSKFASKYILDNGNPKF